MPPDTLAGDLGGGLPAQFRVGPDRVVIVPPGGQHGPGMGKRGEQGLVEAFVAKATVEALPDHGVSRLTWLKSIPVAVKPDHIRHILERLRFVRQIGIAAEAADNIHLDRYRQFVREGRVSATYMIERYATTRRQATLVAFLIDIEERLTDSALEMADKLIGSMFKHPFGER